MSLISSTRATTFFHYFLSALTLNIDIKHHVVKSTQ